jgi:selenocysteine lyase/cysteine desulfurase
MTDEHYSHIYLDTAASTPVADEVIEEMLPYLKERYGNGMVTPPLYISLVEKQLER